MYPKELRYSTEHEWAKVEGKQVRVGITKFAAEKLTDVVFVDLPQKGVKVGYMQPFGVIESVKAVSDLYSPISGTVVDVNTKLVDAPEVVNTDPYGEGWMILVQPEDSKELDKLMTADQYATMVGETGS
ncbi:MAG: glycine cleavage system protein GcvH [bacterium]